MMASYPTKLNVCVMGSDRGADGVLAIPLPCTPSVGLYISDVYTRGLLYVDQPIMSAITGNWSAWCSTIAEEDMTCDQITASFVGPWEWTYVALPKDDNDTEEDCGDEPSEPTPTTDTTRKSISDKDYDRAIEVLRHGRTTTPENN